jgi:hypothetical protein
MLLLGCGFILSRAAPRPDQETQTPAVLAARRRKNETGQLPKAETSGEMIGNEAHLSA